MDFTADRLANFARGMQRLKLLEDAERCQESFVEYVKAAWNVIDPSPYQHNWHIDAICEHLEAVADGEIQKLLINIPPRHSKTLICSVLWPTWVWAQERDENRPLIGPQARFMCLSYAEKVVFDAATTSRRLLESEWYRSRWGARVALTHDQAAKEKYDNTAGGSRISSPIGGQVLGRGADFRILDDPNKADDANSHVMLEGVIRSYEETLRSRVTDPRTSATVAIMQRLSTLDLSGHLLESEPDFVHLCIPEEFDTRRRCVTVLAWNKSGEPEQTWQDPRTEDGELLWPERFSSEYLAPYRRNEYVWAGQYQQLPRPRGGAIIREDWWQLWGNPDDESDPTYKQFPSCELVIASLDPAYTEKQENDYSALTVWGVWRNPEGLPKLILMDAWQERLALHDLVEKSARSCRRFRVDRLLIEAKASGISVAQELRRLYAGEGWGIQTVDPKGDKMARVYAVQPIFADEMVYAPARAWAAMVQNDMADFPRGAHDDLTESATQALRWLRDNGFLRRGEEVGRELTEAMVHRSVNSKPLYGAV